MIFNVKRLLSYSIREIHHEKDKGKYNVIASSCTCDENSVTLGLYSTEERALQVLNLLNEWLIMDKKSHLEVVPLFEKKKSKFTHTIIKNYFHFRMPRDNGELDTYGNQN